MEEKGIVEYFGLGEGHRCGYCGQSDTNISHGMWAHNLTCQGYEDLLNRGWRRSGKYVYKPLMDKLCCPMHTIRCDTTEFKLSKSQKKVLKKMRKFLVYGTAENEAEAQEEPSDPKVFPEGNQSSAGPQPDSGQKTDESISYASNVKVETGTPRARISEAQKTDDGTNVKPCKKAKLIRRENKMKRLAERKARGENVECGKDQSTPKRGQNDGKSLGELIDDFPEGLQCTHKLEVKLFRVNSGSQELKKDFKKSFQLFCKYQREIHKDPIEKLKEGRFKRFLVDCPLIEEEPRAGVPSTGLGAFHQQYYIDGKLIAVGVIDILPHCLSSKYFFYDPDYDFLSLGTYSALREIYFIQTLQQGCPGFKYYCMGYYIHSCQKMRYKGQYHPSYLLCPEAYTFQPIKQCIDKLQEVKYARFDPTDDESEESVVDFDELLVLSRREVMPSSVYLELLVKDEKKAEEVKELEEYARLAGNATREMIIYRASK